MKGYEIIAPIVRPPLCLALRLREACRNATSRVNPRLILLTAHPRSGTTAVAALLAKHCGLRAFTQTGRWTLADKEIVASRLTMEEVITRNRYAFSFDIMSAADAGCFLPAMKAALPEMRIIVLVRDPRDMVCSVIERINDYDVSSAEINDPDYRYLQTDWLGITEEDPLKKLALRWNKWLETAKSVDGVVYRRYEDFLRNKPDFIAALADELGLPARHDISDDMNRQMSKHGRDVPIRGAGRWRRMLPAEHARAIEDICKDGMLAFGYTAEKPTAADAVPGH